jgi:hypothetical protein
MDLWRTGNRRRCSSIRVHFASLAPGCGVTNQLFHSISFFLSFSLFQSLSHSVSVFLPGLLLYWTIKKIARATNNRQKGGETGIDFFACCGADDDGS